MGQPDLDAHHDISYLQVSPPMLSYCWPLLLNATYYQVIWVTIGNYRRVLCAPSGTIDEHLGHYQVLSQKARPP